MAENSPQIDINTFWKRWKKITQAWSGSDSETDLSSVSHLWLLSGVASEDSPYRKTTGVQIWLLGYEFPSTLLVLSPQKILVVASTSKVKILQPLVDSAPKHNIEIEVLARTKEAEHNRAIWEKALEHVDGKQLGVFVKDSFEGKFVEEWKSFLDSNKKKLNLSDVSPQVASIMASKEQSELDNASIAAKLSDRLVDFFNKKMSEAIDADKKITHEKLAEQVEAQLDSNALWSKFNPGIPGINADRSQAEMAYLPIIQSGGQYDLRSSAVSNDERLKSGVILCSIGVRYTYYGANVGRTYMIDPNKSKAENYSYLCNLQEFALQEMKDGVAIKDFYQSIKSKIAAERPELEQNLPKNIGFALGIEFRESAYVISPKTTKSFRAGMVFSLSLGLSDIPDSDKRKPYSLSLIDTVQVLNDKGLLLSSAPKTPKDIQFWLENEEEDYKPKTKGSKKQNGHVSPKKSATSGAQSQSSAVLKAKQRAEHKGADDSAQALRTQHQRELAEKKHQEALSRYAGAETKDTQERRWKRFESYGRESQLPESTKDQQIVVDVKRQSIILPINGFAVPFHINTIKSAIKQEEGEYTVIRLMFVTPGQIQGKKEDTIFEDENATFIRNITLRSTDHSRFADVHRKITELKKSATKVEQDRKEMADVVEQDRLIEDRQRRPPRLPDTLMRPQFEGKRSAGDLEIHQNGLRWQSNAKSEHKADILFSNVKNLFFQPCDHELIVLIHITLQSPIMIGKKKVKEIQFIREASDASDETGNRKRRRHGDEDEIEMEQEERKHRGRLNKEFRAFAEKITEAANQRFELQVPFRDLGFHGVPNRQLVLLQPATYCLVYLTESPFFVINLDEVEVAHLERVQFGLSNFDLVFVFSDLTRIPVHVNTIPMEDLENVKAWLDSADIPFSEGQLNLNWTQIMKSINEDPYGFYKEGGFGFLRGGGEDGSEEDESSDEGDNVYSPSSSEDEDEYQSDSISDEDSGSASEEESEEEYSDE